jgi:hypothetical protein
METVPRDTFARYHAAVVRAVGSDPDELMKFRAKLGAGLLEDFVASLDRGKLSDEEIATRLHDYLVDDLKIADEAELTIEGNTVTLAMKGCHICFGNDLQRLRSLPVLCPIAPGVNRVLAKSCGGSCALGTVDKPGPVGQCTINYTLQL